MIKFRRLKTLTNAFGFAFSFFIKGAGFFSGLARKPPLPRLKRNSSNHHRSSKYKLAFSPRLAADPARGAAAVRWHGGSLLDLHDDLPAPLSKVPLHYSPRLRTGRVAGLRGGFSSVRHAGVFLPGSWSGSSVAARGPINNVCIDWGAPDWSKAL